MAIIPEFILKWNFLKTLVISAIIFGIGFFFGFVSPKLLERFIRSQINLTPNSDTRPIFEKLPFHMDFKIYMFNTTNPDDVTKGEKPTVKEIGPYFFELWKEKLYLDDNDEEDTVTYHIRNTYIFRPDLSGPGLTGDEIITMPHPMIPIMLLTLNVDKKPMLPMASKAIDVIFNEPQHIFWTGRVMDVLFDGVPIDCSDEDNFQAQAVCGVFESGDIKSVKPLNATHYKVSFFGSTNATDQGEVTVFRGKKNSPDIGRVTAFNGEEELDVWDGDECNQFIGTDSTIFAPYMDDIDGIWAFEPGLCRSIHSRYVGKSKYKGIKTSEFAVDISSFENSKQCYCRGSEKCMKKGTFDLFPCMGAALIASQPHFYGCNPILVDNFASGIEPNKAKHAINFHFEMITGTPMKALKRLQFNLEVVPIDDIPYMADLQEMYYPLFWIEEGVELNKTFINQVKPVVWLYKIQSFFKWTGLIFGSLGLLISLTLFCIIFYHMPKVIIPPPPKTPGTIIDVHSIENK